MFQILFKVNFTQRLSVYGEAEKIVLTDEEDNIDHALKKRSNVPVASNPSTGVTLEPPTTVPADPSTGVTHEPSISVPENLPIRVTNEPPTRVPANPSIEVTHEPLISIPSSSPIVPSNSPIGVTIEPPAEVPENPSIGVTQEPSTSKPEEVNQWIGVPTKFAIFVENAQLVVEYVRVVTLYQGIVSEIITEEVNFQKLKVKNEILEKQGLLVDQQMKKVEDEMSLLQKLADSWMVSFINTINNRYIKPNMLELSRPLLQRHKDKVLKQIGVMVLQSLTNNFFLWRGKPLETADKLLTKYPIDQLELRNFRRFTEFIPFSTSNLVQENGTCLFNEIYCHTLIFDYYMLPIDMSEFDLPSINWQYVEPVESGKPLHRPKITDDLSYYIVTSFSIKLTINTDKLGRAISTQVETHVPMEDEVEHNRRELHRYLDAILKTVETLISERVKEKIEFNL